MRNAKVTGGSWLIFSNVQFGPGFSKVCQAGKSVLLTPLFSYFHLLLISQESHISSSSVYFYYVLSPSSLLPHPFPSFSTGWYICSLNSGFRAHTLSSWSHICHICQYLHYCSIKHVVFSASHASKRVKTGSQQRGRALRYSTYIAGPWSRYSDEEGNRLAFCSCDAEQCAGYRRDLYAKSLPCPSPITFPAPCLLHIASKGKWFAFYLLKVWAVV